MHKAFFVIEKITKNKIKRIISFNINTIFAGINNIKPEDSIYLKKVNIKLFAEIGIFVGKKLWEKYPESRPVNKYGKPIKPNDWYYGICPNHPQVRKNKLNAIKTALSRLKIDGIWLDFIRYPGRWEFPNPKFQETCFCKNCLSKFEKDTGIDLPKDFNQAIKQIELNKQLWQNWKINNITSFVKKVKTSIKKLNKKTQLGIFLVPQTKTALALGQNYKDLANIVDVLTPMTYHAMCGKNPEWIVQRVNYLNKFKKKVLPIIQTENKPRRIDQEEFDQSIQQALKPPSSGVIVFFLEDFLNHRSHLHL